MLEILYSPAKINLGLWVLNKREDGYHDIFTLYHTIDFYDRIVIRDALNLSVKTTNLNPELQNENNLVYKAIVEFEKATGIEQNLEIIIEKNIPVGGGLGGGSSNAAAILNYLNKKHGYVLSEEEIFNIAKKLGADVPFFLKGGFALAEGIGDKLTFLDKKLDKDLFIIYPNVKSETKKVYSQLKSDILTKKEDLNIIFNLINMDNIDSLFDFIENKLGEVAKSLYPEIKEVYDFLVYLGYKPFITGSGSCIYVLGKPSENILKVCDIRNWKLIQTKFR